MSNEVRVSRREAAERLIDIAYALTTGGRLTLDRDEEVTVPVVDEVVLRRKGKSNGDRVEIEIELSWSTTTIH